MLLRRLLRSAASLAVAWLAVELWLGLACLARIGEGGEPLPTFEQSPEQRRAGSGA